MNAEYQTTDNKIIKTPTDLGFKHTKRNSIYIFDYTIELGKVLNELKTENDN